jgi:hypothetical protein
MLLATSLILVTAFASRYAVGGPTNQQPVAAFTYSPQIPGPGDVITFNASTSHDPDGRIVQYLWDLGDGTVANVTNPTITHSYSVDGNYTVELTVVDDGGATGVAAAIVQVQKEVYFRVCWFGTVVPLSNVQVTVYYDNGTAWVKAPARSGNPGVNIIYDNMTQPKKADKKNNTQLYRNPGFTAYSLLHGAANIGFDTHPSDMVVFFKFEWGPNIAYWPTNDTSKYYRYDKYHASTEVEYYSPCGQPYNISTSIYVIKAAHIKSSEDEPIVVGVYCPPPVQQWYLNVRTDPTGITTIPNAGFYANNTSVTLTAPTYVSVSTNIRYRLNYWDVDGTSQGSGVNPITVLMRANHTATAHYIEQFWIAVTSAHDSPTASAWVDQGSSLTTSVTSPADIVSGDHQWVCTGYSVDGGGSTPGTTYTFINVQAAHSIVFSWKEQFWIAFAQSGVGSDFTGTIVIVDGSNYDRNGTSFWCNASSVHTFSLVSPLVVNANKNYTWSSTSGLSTLQSDTLTITTSGSVVGNYIVQNQITFDQVGVDSDFTGTVVTIDTVSYAKTQLPISFSWSVGSIHNFTFQSPLVVGAGGKQYVWTSTTGLSTLQNGPITVSTYGSIIGHWQTQYYLTVASAHDSPSPAVGDTWYDAGTLVTASVSSPADQSGGTQFRCTGWSGSGSVPGSGTGLTTTFNINAASSITWNWQTQYYLTVVTDPSGIDSPSGAGWYDSGASATISTGAFADIVPGSSRYRFNGWATTNVNEIADPLRSPTNVLMDEAKTVTADYAVQYLVAFDQSGVSSDFTGTVVTIDSINYNVTGLPGNATFWWDKDSVHTFAYQSPLVVSANTKQYVWTSTSGLSTLQSGSITVSSSGSVMGNYNTQHVLIVLTNPSGLSPQPSRSPVGQAGPLNGWWYEASTSVTLTAQSVQGYTFNYWDVEGISQGNGVNPITVSMSGPHTAKANYAVSPNALAVTIIPGSATIYLEDSVAFTSTVSGGTAPYTYQWYLNGNSVPGATSSDWTFTPGSSGIYYVYLRVIDAQNNAVQSDTARIIVLAGRPVGGYSDDSVFMAKQVPLANMSAHLALVALFVVALSLVRRKRK